MPVDFGAPEWQIAMTILGYSVAVILASLAGGMLPEWIQLTHTRMQLMISFVGGVMLGIAIFHMIPHALAALGPGEIDQVMWGVMLGLVAMFFLLRCFHFHQHGPADFADLSDVRGSDVHANAMHAQGKHGLGVSGHDHGGHDHQHAAGGGCQHAPPDQARWLAVLLGLGIHTFMDGVALASGVVAEAAHIDHVLLPGLGIFLAVLLHKPLDAVSVTSLMHPVTTPTKRMCVNLGFALMCPLGAFLFLGGMLGIGGNVAQSLAGWGLAFSAGVFLCISLSDLLPEMEFHSHSRIPLTIALLLGIAAAWAIGILEGEHMHRHAPALVPGVVEPADGHDHSREDHVH